MTVFSPERMDFTRAAHLAARDQVYALMWPEGVTFEDKVGTAQDLNYAIDAQLAVTVPGLRGPIRLSVQERFREPEAMRFEDLTITEWNLATNQPSELHKLAAQLFVYGYFHRPSGHICRALAVDVGLLQWAFTHGGISPRAGRRPGGDQSFKAFAFDDLRRIGAVLFEHDDRRLRDESGCRWACHDRTGGAA